MHWHFLFSRPQWLRTISRIPFNPCKERSNELPCSQLLCSSHCKQHLFLQRCHKKLGEISQIASSCNKPDSVGKHDLQKSVPLYARKQQTAGSPKRVNQSSKEWLALKGSNVLWSYLTRLDAHLIKEESPTKKGEVCGHTIFMLLLQSLPLRPFCFIAVIKHI